MPKSVSFAVLLLLGLVLLGCKSDQVQMEPEPITNVVTVADAPRFVLGETDVETNTPGPPPPVAAPAPLPKPVITLPKFSPGWVPLADWTAAHKFPKPRFIGTPETPGYLVDTRTRVITFRIGQRMLRLDGVSCGLGFAPRYLRGQPHIHSLDIEKTLHPLLFQEAKVTRARRVIVIDPGHGGTDGGTTGAAREIEKVYVLDWALRLGQCLRTNGWQVHFTRTNDVDVSLPARVAFADRVQADLFVSLHFNSASPSVEPSGVETYCLTPEGMPSNLTRNYDDNRTLVFPNNHFDQENLQHSFRMHRELIQATRAGDGGVRRARFMAVLRGQNRPAVLIEGGYLSNPRESRLITSAAYRQKLAEAVARALE